MDTPTPNPSMAQQVAQAASAFQQRSTGHTPHAVTAVLNENIVVIALHGALTPAEKAVATTPAGAAQVQEFHRQLFTSSAAPLRQEIEHIMGVAVREATAEVEPASGTVVHVFTSGAMVQVFRLRAASRPRNLERAGSQKSSVPYTGIDQTVNFTHESPRWVRGGSPRSCENGGFYVGLVQKGRESVVVGGSDGFHRLLRIAVLGIQSEKVKLGFEIDADVPVHRLEVWERMCAKRRTRRLERDQDRSMCGEPSTGLSLSKLTSKK